VPPPVQALKKVAVMNKIVVRKKNFSFMEFVRVAFWG
jgi:hypothetical protein